MTNITNPIRPFVFAAACSVFTFQSLAQSNPAYSFTAIVDTTTLPFTGNTLVGDVNPYGVVVFSVNDPPALRGVYIDSGLGASVRVIDGSTGSYTSFGKPDINCHGHVAVNARTPTGNGVILVWDGGTPFVIFSASDVWHPEISDNQCVAFWAVEGGVEEIVQACYANGSPSGAQYLEWAFGPVASLHRSVAINRSNNVAYGLTKAGSNDDEIHTITHHPLEVLGPNQFKTESSIVMNMHNHVGFFAGSDFWLDLAPGNNKQILVNNTQGLGYRSLDMNCWYVPSYYGGTGGSRAYAGPSQATDAVLWTGGSVPLPQYAGLTISLVLPGGINNRGQTSNYVRFNNGLEAIIRANPLAPSPECESCPALAPTNDDFSNAHFISVGATDFSTINATTDGPDLPPTCDEGNGNGFERDVWYTFLAPEAVAYAISTCGNADFDTRLAVYTSFDGIKLELLDCNDNAPGCPGNTSTISSLQVVAGQQYFIRVGSSSTLDNPQSGTGSLTIELAAPSCPADIDGNGIVNAADVGAFLNAYFTDLANGTTFADFDGNGIVNAADVGAYLNEYLTSIGNCP